MATITGKLEVMKVTISITVEHGYGWDEDRVEKEINIQADDIGVLLKSASMACISLSEIVEDAITERAEKPNKEEEE